MAHRHGHSRTIADERGLSRQAIAPRARARIDRTPYRRYGEHTFEKTKPALHRSRSPCYACKLAAAEMQRPAPPPTHLYQPALAGFAAAGHLGAISIASSWRGNCAAWRRGFILRLTSPATMFRFPPR